MEEWKNIPGLVGYQASSLGRIRGLRGVLSTFIRPSGYRVCQAGGKQWRVNRLICLTFHGEPPTILHHAAHRNGIRHDNRKENLYWATPAENNADIVKHGSLKGAKHPKAKLTKRDVEKIRERRKAGEQIKVIHQSYTQVCYATISHVCNNRNWS